MAALRWWSSLTASALLLGLVLPAGCAGGGGGGGNKPKAEESLDPYPETPTDEDIRHLLSRTQFASTEAEVQAVRAAGITNYVQQMIAFTPNPALETQATAATMVDPNLPSGTEVAQYY